VATHSPNVTPPDHPHLRPVDPTSTEGALARKEHVDDWNGVTKPRGKVGAGRFLKDVIVELDLADRERVDQAVETARQTGITLDDLAGVAVGIGPGLYTGLRVGVTSARTLAQVLDVPVVGIPSLDLVAYPWRATHRRIVALIERRAYSERPPRLEYRLTDKGKSLGPVLRALRDLGERHS